MIKTATFLSLPLPEGVKCIEIVEQINNIFDIVSIFYNKWLWKACQSFGTTPGVENSLVEVFIPSFDFVIWLTFCEIRISLNESIIYVLQISDTLPSVFKMLLASSMRTYCKEYSSLSIRSFILFSENCYTAINRQSVYVSLIISLERFLWGLFNKWYMVGRQLTSYGPSKYHFWSSYSKNMTTILGWFLAEFLHSNVEFSNTVIPLL